MVSNARWTPTYELRASSSAAENGTKSDKGAAGSLPSPLVTLHYAAAVKQETGEDWTQAHVSVSTAAPGRWAHIPRVRRMHVAPGQPTGAKPSGTFNSFAQNIQQQQQKVPGLYGIAQTNNAPSAIGGFGAAPSNARFGAFGCATQSNTVASGPLFGSAPLQVQSAAAPPRPSAEEDTEWTSVGNVDADASRPMENVEPASEWSATRTVVRASAVASTFRVEHACTIPSESTPHRLVIATIPLNAEIGYVVVPRTAPEAFVEVISHA